VSGGHFALAAQGFGGKAGIGGAAGVGGGVTAGGPTTCGPTGSVTGNSGTGIQGTTLAWVECVTGGAASGYSVQSLVFSLTGTISGTAAAGIYTNSAGVPTNLVCNSSSQSAVSGNNTFALSGCGTLPAYTPYWIALAVTSSTVEVNYVGAGLYQAMAFGGNGTFPASYGSVSFYETENADGYLNLTALSGPGSSLPVDVLTHMNTSTPGTALTTTILGNGTDGGNCSNAYQANNCSWSSVSGSGLEVGANVASCDLLEGVQVRGGSSYALGYGEHSIEVIGPDGESSATLTTGSTQVNFVTKNATATFCVQTPNAISTGVLDLFIMTDANGNNVALQLQDTSGGGACSGADFDIELPVGGGQAASCIAQSANTVYWISVNVNETTGVVSYSVYSATGSLIGSWASSGGAGPEGYGVSTFVIGNSEDGTPTNNIYFQNLMIDTTGAYPLGPG
jgi:hypothetical protein